MNSNPPDRLVSWKEISAYLGIDERTCQRWEKKYGLPVRRIDPATKSRVFAFKTELDEWLDMHRQQLVIELVDLRPVISRVAARDSHCSEYVVKNRVKTYIAKPQLIGDDLELRLAVGTNQSAGKIGKDNMRTVMEETPFFTSLTCCT